MQSISRSQGYMGAGILGILLSAGYLHKALELPMGEMDQPGAGVFPLLIAGILFLASISALWEGWKNRAHTEALDLPKGEDGVRLVKLVALLISYFVAIPWLGFALSSVLFCILLIRLLSALSWQRCAAYAVIMTAVVYLIFITILKVPMPAGILVELFRS